MGQLNPDAHPVLRKIHAYGQELRADKREVNVEVEPQEITQSEATEEHDFVKSGLSSDITAILVEAGYDTVGKVRAWYNEPEQEKIKGLGAKKLEAIGEWLDSFQAEEVEQSDSVEEVEPSEEQEDEVTGEDVVPSADEEEATEEKSEEE